MRRSPASVWLALISGVCILGTGCRDVDVTAVDAARVEVTPADALVHVDDVTHLTARVLGSGGEVLSGRTVKWSSLHPELATVDDAGAVTGIAPGVATIRAASESASGTAAVTITRAPAILLAPRTIEFVAVQGSADPAAQSAAITNGGDGEVSELTLTTVYTQDQPTGWLSAALDRTTAPATIALGALTENLEPGVYEAAVQVFSAVAANSPQRVEVTLRVEQPAPEIAVDSTHVQFTTTRAGGDPSAVQLAVVNAGGGALSDLALAIIHTDGEPGGWLNAELSTTSAPATLTLAALRGALDVGTYSATVRITSAAVPGAPLDIAVTFAIAESPPAAPSDLAAAAVSERRIDLSWTDNSATESDFVVERSHDGGNWTEIATVEAGLSSFVDSVGLTPSTDYSHRVRACNVAGCSTAAGNASARTAPAPPSDLLATVAAATRVDLEWTDNSADESHFDVERSTDGSAWMSIHTSAPDATSFMDASATPETIFFYRVRACRTTLCSTPADTAAATTGVAPPGAPSALTATPVAGSPTEIDLEWVAGTGAVDEYRIERDVGAGFAAHHTVDGGTLTYRDTGLTAATQYVYRIQACNVGGCSGGYSNETEATTNPNPPGAPTDLEVSAADSSSSSMTLTWTAAPGVVTEYRIERRTAGGEFEEVATEQESTLTHTDDGLAPSTQYFYRMLACNAGGCSAASAQAQATTNPAAPSTPGVLAAAAVPGMSSAIDIVWAPSAGNVVEYRIERRTGMDEFAWLITVPAGATAHQDSDLAAGTLYVYRVAACNAGGCSAFTNEAPATTNS